MTVCKGRVLTVAGSDSGGGAGIQADVKTITALGGYAATVVTAVTAQNTLGVRAIHPVPQKIIRLQMEAVLEDIGADCIKTGMLAGADVIEMICERLAALARNVPVVVDPVMVATSGDRLIDEGAIAALKNRLLPMAALLTPNIPEAEILSGMKIEGRDAMREAGLALLALGAQAVLMKGGHMSGAQVQDILISAKGIEIFSSPRIDTRHTHGTGCTLASAIATGLAQGMALPDAVRRARDYVQEAIRTAPGLGAGHGPLHHGHTMRDFDAI
ncbi:MAG: bifunctional hydroxymethylpyrimidine kinase/phosphomethylpyrimidine kinase [Alphaproteobacteria bacterium]|nr:bifunctional hydroxymethylpyrimidine kinase/phosphomethylpyrimidine kinase [Alphaproteobacteria bacterium]